MKVTRRISPSEMTSTPGLHLVLHGDADGVLVALLEVHRPQPTRRRRLAHEVKPRGQARGCRTRWWGSTAGRRHGHPPSHLKVRSYSLAVVRGHTLDGDLPPDEGLQPLQPLALLPLQTVGHIRVRAHQHLLARRPRRACAWILRKISAARVGVRLHVPAALAGGARRRRAASGGPAAPACASSPPGRARRSPARWCAPCRRRARS